MSASSLMGEHQAVVVLGLARLSATGVQLAEWARGGCNPVGALPMRGVEALTVLETDLVGDQEEVRDSRELQEHESQGQAPDTDAPA